MKLTASLSAIAAVLLFATAHGGDLYSDQLSQLQAAMNRANATIENSQQQLMANPEIQRQFYEYQQSGGQNSFEQFVYFLGQTPEGQARRIDGTNQAIQGVQDAYGNFNNAVTADGVSRSNSHDEFGNALVNNATYQDPGTGSSYVLPYTWQPNTVNYHEGQQYWVDHAGNYFHVDPNNSGWMTPVYPANGR